MKLRTCPPLRVLAALILIVPALMAQQTGNAPKNSNIENIGKRDVNKGQTSFSSQEGEARLGRQAAAEMERDVTLVDDANIQSYVDRVAQNIARNSDSKSPITIKVVQSNDVNGTALPGGFIYINSGAIKAADNEAELAFVIAHLVGHVAARHSVEGNARTTLMQIGAIPSIILTGGVLGMTMQQTPNSVPQGLFAFTRAAANEADFLGLEYLFKAGYDPRAAVSLLKKLEALEVSRPKQSSLFATHPTSADRIALTESHIRKVLPTRADNTVNTAEFDAIKARVK